ncbi:MAG TPA: YIP1 family protein, partial [Luteimonas sp.]|nr:YIP1 family protein [Luteimonas sp.]
MLYAPRATMPAILADDRRGAMWAILIVWSLLEALLDHAGKFASHGVAAMFGVALLVGFLIVLRQLVFCWLLGVALRVLRTRRVDFDRLLAAVAWGGGPPMIVFMLLALLALLAARGDVTIFEKADDLRHAIPLVSAGLLVLAGYVWSVAGTVNAVSVAADVRRRRVVAALALLLVLAVLLVGAVFLLLR